MKKHVIVNFAHFLESKDVYYNGGWVKKIDSINKELQNGYCFEGDFVRKSGLVEVQIGIYLICDIQGSRKNQKKYYYFGRLQENGEFEVIKKVTGIDWVLKVRDMLLELPEFKEQKEFFDPISYWENLDLNEGQRQALINYIKKM